MAEHFDRVFDFTNVEKFRLWWKLHELGGAVHK